MRKSEGHEFKWNVLKTFLLGIGFIALAACGPVKIPVQSTYFLGKLHSTTATTAKTPWTILVMSPIASPGYQTSDLIYVTEPYELKSFSKNRWVAPPAPMLGLVIAQSLQERSYFRAVVSPPFLGYTDYQLEIHLLKLQQEFMTPVSRVRLTVQVSLLNSRQKSMVASRRFEVVVPAPGNNPYSGVVAANKAAQQLGQRIANFCIEQLPSGSESSPSP